MGLLDADIIEELLHSSSISKGIERTMEQMINELEMDGMYIIHYEREIMNPEIAYDWENGKKRHNLQFQSYIDAMEEGYHFENEDMYVIEDVSSLAEDEKKLYQDFGYETVVEYQMTNHGNVIGYIILGWEQRTAISDEEENAVHVLFKLMNMLLIKQFYKEVMGQRYWKLFRLVSSMTRIMIYMIDEDYRIHFVNNYAKDEYPNISIGDFCYKAIQGEDTPCKECPIKALKEKSYTDEYKYIPFLDSAFHVHAAAVEIQENKRGYTLTMQKQENIREMQQRTVLSKKFIFALGMLYKDVIAVEIRKDTFYNLLEQDVDNRCSYSMDFVLKWLSKVHLDDKQKFLECFDINFLQNAYMTGTVKKEIDFRYRTHEGSYHCMNGKILFDQNANKDVTVYILFQDVEQIKNIQIEEYRQLRDSLMAAKSSAELKGSVLANISHEIRDPMSGINSMVSVAKQVYKQEDKLLECLTNIDHYTESMMQIMDSLLATVKVSNDAIEIAKQPFNLEHFLNRIDIAVRETIEKKNVQFYIESQCRYVRLLGDEIRLYQAMSTLINNTISYTPISGEIRLTAKQIATDAKMVYIRFILEDTGNGLTAKMKESIFGFSHNEENGFIDEEHFNLSLSARIIQLMGGEIGMNVDADGTSLYFTLPFELQEVEKNQPIKKKAMPAIGDFTGKKILLAEDSEMAQDALRAVLEVVGFEVNTVDNGKKAVIQFISQPAFTYDAIITDVHMPFMDGREATRCIRISGKEDGEKIPIIGLMSNTYEDDIKESIQAGMQAHLAKPVDVDKLYKVLKKVIPVEEEI